ncbi:hypothetical protein EMIT051CA3_90192 [Pseudomonas chlororaphis]
MRFLQSRIFVTILRYGHKLSINSIDQHFKKTLNEYGVFRVIAGSLNRCLFVTIDRYGHCAENVGHVLLFGKGTYAPASTCPHCRLLVASSPGGVWRLIHR